MESKNNCVALIEKVYLIKVNTFPYAAVVNKVMQKQQQLQQAATAALCLARSQMNNYY